ncbi:MAG: ferritin family protein [Ignavibacteriales bacterium]
MTPYQLPCPAYPPGGPWHTLISDILTAIRGEAEAIQMYTRLLGMAQTEEDRTNLQHILNDERKHYAAFTRVYAMLTGMQSPPVQAPSPAFRTYAEGLKEAYYDELEAAELYRTIVLSSGDLHVYRAFFEAMVDETEHAIRLNRLLYLAEEAGD